MSVVLNDQKYSLALDSNELIRISHDVFEKIHEPIRKVLKDSRLRPGDLEAIVLVGGSCKMPTVISYIEKVTGIKPCTDIDPDTAIGFGAGIYSGIKSKNADLKEVVMTDICPFSLGTSTLDFKTDERIMSFIIERNSMLPCSNIRDYYAIRDNQTSVTFDIFQGESIIPENNIKLGSITISCPSTKKHDFIASARLTYDINGILIVDITNADKETTTKMLLDSNVRLSPKDMERIKAKLDSLRFSEKKDEEQEHLISRAERIIEETLSFEREMLIIALQDFKTTMKYGNSVEKRKAKEQFSAILDHHEFE